MLLSKFLNIYFRYFGLITREFFFKSGDTLSKTISLVLILDIGLKVNLKILLTIITWSTHIDQSSWLEYVMYIRETE